MAARIEVARVRERSGVRPLPRPRVRRPRRLLARVPGPRAPFVGGTGPWRRTGAAVPSSPARTARSWRACSPWWTNATGVTGAAARSRRQVRGDAGRGDRRARHDGRGLRWLADQGADAARCGMGALMPFVTDDYESLPPSILRFNPPYYHAFLKDAGFESSATTWTTRSPCARSSWRAGTTPTAAERAGFRLVPLRGSPEARAALTADIFNETFSAHWGMSPVTAAGSDVSRSLRVGRRARHVGDRLPGRRADGSGDRRARTRVRVRLARPDAAPGGSGSTVGIGSACRRGRGLHLGVGGLGFRGLARRGAEHVSYPLVLDDNWPSRRTAERLGAEVCANYAAYRCDFGPAAGR